MARRPALTDRLFGELARNALIERHFDGLFRFFETGQPGVLQAIAEKRILDDDLKAALAAALDEYGQTFAASTAAA